MNPEAIKPAGSYLSPQTSVVEIFPEGILCDSGDDPTETLDENFGSW